MSQAVTTADTPLISFIERASRDPEFDIQKFGELLRLQREVEHDQARKAFNRAMAAAQSEMLPVMRDAKNSHLGNRYAKLETIDAALRPIYTRHGFSVRYGSAPSPHEGWMRITCTVAHDDGYFEENYLDSPVSTTGAQGGRMAVTPVQAIGSTVTYLRRYLLGMIWNAVLADDEDDDGEATRRAAAAATRRPERVYATDQGQPPNGNGRTKSDAAVLEGWRIAFDSARDTEAVRRLETGLRYTAAMEQAPVAIADALRALCAQAYLRVQPAAAPIGNAPENATAGADRSPWDNETPIEVAGA